MNFIYTSLILLCIGVGMVSFIAGLLVIVLRRTSWLFQTYLWALLATVAVSVAVVSWGWSKLSLAAQIVYIALCLLGAYAVYRSFSARQKQAYRYTGWRLEFMDDICVTLIYLFGALVIVGGVTLGMPVWACIIVAVTGGIAGYKWLPYEKSRYIADRKRYNEKKLRRP